MAFILGIYQDLLAAIKAFDVTLLRDLRRGRWTTARSRIPWRFLIPLGLGIVTAVLSLAELLSYLLHHFEPMLFAFFFGLVAASVATLGMRERWTVGRALACLLGAAVAYFLVGMVPVEPGHTPVILFSSGAIAICAMILPGISGSFLLLILGQYKHCVDAISQFISAVRGLDLASTGEVLFGTILPFAAGAAIGLTIFARVLSWLLVRHGAVTVAVLIGFMIGSLRRLWPFKQYLTFVIDRHGEQIPLEWRNVWPVAGQDAIGWAAGLVLLGFTLICVIDHVYDRRNPFVLLLTKGRWRRESKQAAT